MYDAWAKIEPVSGGESFAAGGVGDYPVYRMWIRYRNGIDSTMRATVQQTGMVLFFNTVLILGPKLWLQIDCKVGSS